MYYLIQIVFSANFALILFFFWFFRDLNRLIMDYLVIEGYKSAAEEFSQEANLAPPVDFESIESRMDIREALQRGDVEEAITRVNDLNPEVCVFSRQGQGTQRIKPFHAPLINPSGLVMIFVNTKTSVFNMICVLPRMSGLDFEQ